MLRLAMALALHHGRTPPWVRLPRELPGDETICPALGDTAMTASSWSSFGSLHHSRILRLPGRLLPAAALPWVFLIPLVKRVQFIACRALRGQGDAAHGEASRAVGCTLSYSSRGVGNDLCRVRQRARRECSVWRLRCPCSPGTILPGFPRQGITSPDRFPDGFAHEGPTVLPRRDTII